jgi:hypothetical protein
LFERFTDGARRVVVLAQEEARLLSHNYIGTEHLLLGVIREAETRGEGVAAAALESLDLSLDAARAEVGETVGRGGSEPSGHIPFTPRARKTLEHSMGEALGLGHDYIGTEHILLALLQPGDGEAAQVLAHLGVDMTDAREQVVRLLSVFPEPRSGRSGPLFGHSRESSMQSMQFPEEGEDPIAFARRMGFDPDLQVVLDQGMANAIRYLLDGLDQMFRLDAPTPAQMRHFPEPFELPGFTRMVLDGALQEIRRQLSPERYLEGDATRLNDDIVAEQVWLIGQDGTDLGVKPLSEALAIARAQQLDLVEVAAAADPPVCRLMDYATWRREQDERRQSRPQASGPSSIIGLFRDDDGDDDDDGEGEVPAKP